jgi:hypothetical protein
MRVHRNQTLGLALDFCKKRSDNTLHFRASSTLHTHLQQHLPRGKNFRTRTTTRTLPPGVGLAIPSLLLGTANPSRARKDGLEAVDRRVAAEAEVDIMLGEVIPVAADSSDEAADDIEPGPGWPMWW